MVNSIKKIILIIMISIITTSSLIITIKAQTIFYIPYNKKLYENKIYKISLKYNEKWKKNSMYFEKYGSKDGFFQVAVYSGENQKIDEVVQNEIKYGAKKYGSNPQINKLIIKGQEARLIMPSDDQAKELDNQSKLIVTYPKEIKVDEQIYKYFILWADKNNIKEISQSIEFIN